MIDWTGRTPTKSDKFKELQRVQDLDHRILISADGWKVNLGDGDRGELYDMNSDPTESVNLFDEPSHKDRIKDMESRIRSWQESTGDTATLSGV